MPLNDKDDCMLFCSYFLLKVKATAKEKCSQYLVYSISLAPLLPKFPKLLEKFYIYSIFLLFFGFFPLAVSNCLYFYSF
jgi:hypothetical protein